MYVSYYSRIRNVIGGDVDALIEQERNKIVTKEIDTSNWHIKKCAKLFEKVGILYTIILNSSIYPINSEQHYREFRIPKASGGFRIIHAPDEQLKYHQNLIKNFLERDCRILSHNAVHSYVKNRNCKTALETHRKNGARWFLKIDIKDFFDNCKKEAVIQQLYNIHPLNHARAHSFEMALDICFLNNSLPQGAPTSPILSNLYLMDFDYKLTNALPTFTYTRYADDILISSKTHFDYRQVVQIVEDLLESLGLQIKHRKTRYGNYNGSNWNLGLMYNSNADITVGYKNKKLIKNKIHNLFTNEPEDKTSNEYCVWLDDVCSLRGVLGYYKHIEPEYFSRLIEKYKKKGYAL